MDNSIELSKWIRDRGDYTHNLNYDLNSDSVVMDLGGYTSIWAQQILDKYNPNIYIIEPVPTFYDTLVSKFNSNNKVNLLNVGVATENKKDIIYVNNDGSSLFSTTGTPKEVNFCTIDNILNSWNLDKIDLVQINIEGGEYPLMEYMLSNGTINMFNNIQVQFHCVADTDIIRRQNIRKGLENNNFKIKFDYPFVWESWAKI
jgi:FkbM family methyltransferase